MEPRLRGELERLVEHPFPLLPLRGAAILPGTAVRIPVGRRRSRQLARAVSAGVSLVAVAVQRDPSVEDPGLEDLYETATVARVVRVVSRSRGLLLILEGVGRVQLEALTQREPYWMARGALPEEPGFDADEARALADALRDQLAEIDPERAGTLGEVVESYGESTSPGLFADRVAAALGLSIADELKVLEAFDVVARLRLVTGLAGDSLATRDVRKRIEREVKSRLQSNQREAVLREQLKAIQKELGEADDTDELAQRLAELELPEEVQKAVDRELGRLQKLPQASMETHVVRTWLEWVADLPWSARAEVKLDLDEVEAALEADHYGLDEVKKRILEHMAVLKLSGNPKGSILCLVGPPGVGKTSLGQSIADATGRPLVRIALGGVRDEAEIRGHRRTYVGALPGRIIHGLKKSAVKNPVILFDEIDKLSQGWRGSPEAALLEVLDPEQNNSFTDHYMELPFDLSEALFICTANQLDGISPPLRDRLEIVEITGYTPEEKRHIARAHLIPRQLEAHGITDTHLKIDDDALMTLIEGYTREAGVRQLNRQIVRLCRSLTLKIARGAEPGEVAITADDIKAYLGKRRFESEVAERTAYPGVATGLAWTPVGGDILFIESSRMRGKGRLVTTGQLGDVMQESARAAMTYVRSHADELSVDADALDEVDVHIHVPAGAVPKDGPSAGVTMFTALTSLLSGRRVRHDTAMTGEVTLRGRVLPVGGIKAKVLAAHRAGLTRVILPRRNERDLDDVPEEVREGLEIHLVDEMGQVLELALETDLAPDSPAWSEPPSEGSQETHLA